VLGAVSECPGCGAGAPDELRRWRGAFFTAHAFAVKAVRTTFGALCALVVGAWLVGMYFAWKVLGIYFFPVLVGSALVLYSAVQVGKHLYSSITFEGPTHDLAPRPVKLPRSLLAGRGTTFSGTAAASSGTVSSFLAREECLAAFLMVGRRHDSSLFLRGVRGAGFRVERPSGEPLYVTGNLWVTVDSRGAKSGTREGVSALGLDPEHLIDGDGPGHTMEFVLREGDEVEVTGAESREPAPELNLGYRDSGAVVLRGTPREPVLVHLT